MKNILVLFLFFFLISCNKKSKEAQETPEIPCLDVNSPAKVHWMRGAIDRYSSNKLVKFRYQKSEFSYYFQGKNSYLYDCRGELICESTAELTKDCLQEFLDTDDPKGKTIWLRGK